MLCLFLTSNTVYRNYTLVLQKCLTSSDKFIKLILLSLFIFSSGLSLPRTSEKNRSQKLPNIIVIREKATKSTGLDVGKAD